MTDHLSWFVSAAIVVIGLVAYGFADLTRTRFGRIWAIGGVCFRDAIRRRVLWITPLAMLGILLIGQFQKPFDEADAVRLTVKTCLFTTSLVVVVIALVTAATNLPREIDNRVVFTIVTKPVTRLEIVLGKIVGFARVSAVMLLVMGLFTAAYTYTQAYVLDRQIAAAVNSLSTEPTRRVWLQHYAEQGLLQAQSVTLPASMSQYARPPEKGESGGWVLGGAQDAIVRFQYDPAELISKAAPGTPGAAGIGLVLRIGYEPLRGTTAATTTSAQPAAKPKVAVQIADAATGSILLSPDQIGPSAVAELSDPAGTQPVLVTIAAQQATQFAALPAVNVQLILQSADHLYRVTGESVALLVPDSDTSSRTIASTPDPVLRGSMARAGQQLTGPTRGVRPVAVYAFRGVPAPAARNGRVPFEMRVGVDSNSSDNARDVTGTVEVQAVDRATGTTSPVTVVYPESRRTVFFDLPAGFVSGGDFDLLLHNRTNSHTIGLLPASVSIVTGQEPFAWNLFKALFVQWLLAILTAAVAFCCSTFLSWPIAVVLSTLVLLGHWGVSNVDLGSGIGASVATEFFPTNAEIGGLVNTTVERLSRTITLIASVLPDITAFGVADRIERGTAIGFADLAAPVEVMLVFGLPLLTLSYVFLRNKEVAP